MFVWVLTEAVGNILRGSNWEDNQFHAHY